MPLDAFIAEVISRLEAGDAPEGEILVDDVKGHRYVDRNGDYSRWVGIFNPSYSG